MTKAKEKENGYEEERHMHAMLSNHLSLLQDCKEENEKKKNGKEVNFWRFYGYN